MSSEINKKAEEVRELGVNIKEALLGEGELDTKEVLTKAAIAGVAAILVVWLISKMFGKSKSDEGVGSKKKKKKKNESIFYSMVKQQLGLILLAIFRKHINKLLLDYKLIDEKENL